MDIYTSSLDTTTNIFIHPIYPLEIFSVKCEKIFIQGTTANSEQDLNSFKTKLTNINVYLKTKERNTNIFYLAILKYIFVPK